MRFTSLTDLGEQVLDMVGLDKWLDTARPVMGDDTPAPEDPFVIEPVVMGVVDKAGLQAFLDMAGKACGMVAEIVPDGDDYAYELNKIGG